VTAAFAFRNAVATGASYVKAAELVPTGPETVTDAWYDDPSPGGDAHRTDVRVVQPVVEHRELPTTALAVKSLTPKLTPVSVSCVPPELGVLYTLAAVKTGASKVMPIIPAVPTRELTVSTTFNDEPEPAGTAQRKAVSEVQAAVPHAL